MPAILAAATCWPAGWRSRRPGRSPGRASCRGTRRARRRPSRARRSPGRRSPARPRARTPARSSLGSARPRPGARTRSASDGQENWSARSSSSVLLASQPAGSPGSAGSPESSGSAAPTPGAAPRPARSPSRGDVQRADPADLRNVGHLVGRRQQRGRAAAVLMAERQADVAADGRPMQRHRAVGQLDRDQPQARRPDLAPPPRPGCATCSNDRYRPVPSAVLRADGCIGSAASPHSQIRSTPNAGRGPDDRPEVERLADRLEQQGQAGLRGPAPGPVQPLDLGRAELPAHAVTFSTRYPDLAAARSAGQPGLAQPVLQRIRSQVLLHHQIGSGAGGEPAQPASEQSMQRVLADPDRRVAPDQVKERRAGQDHRARRTARWPARPVRRWRRSAPAPGC